MTTLGAPVSAAGERSPVKGWLAVLAVTLGIFAPMTSELLPVGLLTPVGSALDVSEGTAGLMVTVPGLVAAVAAPLVTVATGHIDRRIVLAVLVGLVGAADLASAFATGSAVVLAARFLIGISVGGFWSMAGGIALRLVPEKHVARATADVFGGVETASVLGVPTGTLIGDPSGWRTAFAAVGVLGLISLACMVFLMPKVPAERTIAFADLPKVFKGNAGVRAGITLTFLVVTGHFLAYTFVRPTSRTTASATA
ncbi:MFS transporter [Streptomyces sp. NPDC008122]|uniref:MFS transporter n=1 Tax=Streptomyces sp. NPDC008122 TaxID=3364810 RepID=UPI0036EC501D